MLAVGQFPAHFPSDLLSSADVGASLLEIGCGAGFDAVNLCRMGFVYTGVDTSSDAVWLTRNRLSEQGLTGQTFQKQFPDPHSAEYFDYVFDRGVFHNQKSQSARRAFALAIHGHLKPGGFWVSICGAAEVSAMPKAHGSLDLREIRQSASDLYDINAVHQRPYGPKNWPGNFSAWHCAFRALNVT